MPQRRAEQPSYVDPTNEARSQGSHGRTVVIAILSFGNEGFPALAGGEGEGAIFL